MIDKFIANTEWDESLEVSIDAHGRLCVTARDNSPYNDAKSSIYVTLTENQTERFKLWMKELENDNRENI